LLEGLPTLTLNEDLVGQAKRMTDNLSAVVESLLADFVAREQRERLAKSFLSPSINWVFGSARLLIRLRGSLRRWMSC
jgi:antitoxin CcdA